MLDRTLRVVHYVKEWLNLTENWIYCLVRSLPQEVSSVVVCEKTKNPNVHPFAELHSLANAHLLDRLADKASRRLGIRDHLAFPVRIARENSADILHSHFGHVGWANIGVARTANVKHVVSFYGTDACRLPVIQPSWHGRYKELFSVADRVLCEGPSMASHLEKLGCPPERLVVHHIGVLLSDIPFVPRLFRSGDILRVLLAATFLEKKGIPDAVRALGKLKKDRVSLAITIIGDATSEERSRQEKFKILNALKESDLMSETRLLGYQPKEVLYREAYAHHVFVSPSRTAVDGDAEGGAPVTITEMSATGMPIISSRHCDIPSVVVDGETGLLADEGDADGLYRHLVGLVQHPQWLTAMGEAGRRHIERAFDARRLGEKLRDIYRNAL